MSSLLVALAAVSAFLTGTHAPAASAFNPDPNGTARPIVGGPLLRPDLQVEAPRWSWGVRHFAREVAREVPGLRIRTRGTCAANPRAVCLRVVIGDWSDEQMHRMTPGVGWYALTSYPRPSLRVIRLNERVTPTANRYAVMAHEFGHVLGLGHHRMHGVDGGWADEVHLSRSEIRVLRRAY